MKLPKGIESGIIVGLEEFIKDLEAGRPIKATRVTREETPDGPLHTFEKVEIKLGEDGLSCGSGVGSTKPD